MNGVSEVYFYCGSNTDTVEEYIGQSRWSPEGRSSPFSVVQFVRVADARSAGDVLRDLDTRSLVDGDFILVHGDLVSNFMLDGVLAAHRKRREENPANIMTVVLRSGGQEEHRTKSNGITPIFAVDNSNQRCLHYDEISPLDSDHYAMLDPAIPDELSTDFDVRADLIDAQIDICTPEVLALWSESFDYELPRKNFLHGVLKDWELNGKMIYAEIMEEGYAARAHNLQMYESVSRDVLSRWTFPFLPENNLTPKQTYHRHPNGVVIERSANHSSTAKLSNSVIGSNTSIGANSIVSNCIIGNDCKIGEGVILQNSYVWNGVTIEKGANVTRSILADSTFIGPGSMVSAGCLLSFKVRLSKGSNIPANTALSTLSSTGQALAPDTSLVGPDGAGALFHDAEVDDLDSHDPSLLQRSLIYSLANHNISTSSISTLSSDLFSEDSDFAADVDMPSSEAAEVLNFHTDAVHGLIDALRADSGDFDSAKLEFMGLRLANDASDSMMRKAVAVAFATRAAELLTPSHGSLDASKAAERALTARPGASKFVAEVGIGGDGEAEQVEFILELQRALTPQKKDVELEAGKAGTVLAALMQQLYALDILEEDGILEWWEDERAVEGEGMAALKDKCRVLVEWLENAEEEDDEDEDDDEDDDE
jgi:translation initiation factor eIF-2B subunit epsilon